jgi:flagellar transcriptional activator FlhC
MPHRAERYVHAVKLAIDCAQLGARVRTIHQVTGLPPLEIQRLLFNDPHTIPRGRAPDSSEWYHSANLMFRTDASVFAASYHRARLVGFQPSEALVGAFRHYRMVSHHSERISFDRAFDLASHLDGIWVARCASFEVVSCPCCESQYLAGLGTPSTSDHCPFCKLVRRYSHDPRVRTSFPARPLPDPRTTQRGTLSLIWPYERPAGTDEPY